MEQEQVEVEYLSPEETPEDQAVELAPLQIQTPLEQFKNLFDRMADIRSKVILWEKKTVITSSKSRDEAIRLRTMVTRTAKLIDDARMDLVKPVQEYIKTVKEYADQAQLALIGTKADPTIGVAGRLTNKISSYALECKRIEEEMKAKALADKKKIDDEIEAWELEAEMKEQLIRLEEQRRLELIEQQRLAQAQEQGHSETDQMEADLAMEEEQARIDSERAERERKLEEQKIANQKTKDEAQSKMVGTMAVASSKGNVKGVKNIWVIELIDESLLEPKFMVYDESKARKYLDGGFYNKAEKDATKIIPGLRCYVALGKGGR